MEEQLEVWGLLMFASFSMVVSKFLYFEPSLAMIEPTSNYVSTELK